MTYSSLLTDYLGQGTAAGRPVSLSIASNALGFYYGDDTQTLTLWNGTAWVTISVGQAASVAGTGIAINTGTVSLAPIGASTLLGNTGTAAAAPGTVTIGAGLTLAAGALALTPAMQKVAIPFSFSGKPGAGQLIHIPMIGDANMSITATWSFNSYVGTNPTAAQSFTLSKINGGVATALGSVNISTAGAVTVSGTSAYTPAAGDTLRFAAPLTQDATLADFAFTLEFTRS